MSANMKRREFITLLGGATVSSHKVWAQQADSQSMRAVRPIAFLRWKRRLERIALTTCGFADANGINA